MLNNDMLVDQINLPQYLDSCKVPTTMSVTQEFYDLIKIKDPTCIYIIIDAKDQRVYHGMKLIQKNCEDRTYLIGPSDNPDEYTLFLNIKEGYNNRLVEITKIDSSQKAIDMITHLNRVGSHNSVSLQCYNLITNYIQRDLSIHDLLIGIISIYGYRDDPRLQSLINYTIWPGSHDSSNDLPEFMKMTIKLWTNNPPNHLYKYYSNLYDLVRGYDHFKGEKFQKEEMDLSGVISNISKIMTSIH